MAIEYLGPLLVAALGRRTWRHGAFALLAALGVVALARPGGGITLVGALFAAGAGLGWAGYAFASARVGRVTTGFEGLAVAMATSALVTLPFTLGRAHAVVTHAGLLAAHGPGRGDGHRGRLRRSSSSRCAGCARASSACCSRSTRRSPSLIGWLLLCQPVTACDALGLAA